jgi:GTP cyclohydrolase I
MLSCQLIPDAIKVGTLTQEAIKVRDALQARGLETPLQAVQHLSLEQRKRQLEGHFHAILQILSLDLSNDSLLETPRRVAKMYLEELFVGLDYAHFPQISVIANSMQLDEMIVVRDIGLTTTCEHHLVTIDGLAKVAYIPDQQIIGLSKINRIVQFFARRPQVQERLTQQILLALQTLLETDNVAVAIDAVHYCVKARGVMDTRSATTTSALGGLFKRCPVTRQAFLLTHSTGG